MEIGITKTQLRNLLKKGKVAVGGNTLKLKSRPAELHTMLEKLLNSNQDCDGYRDELDYFREREKYLQKS